MIIHKWRSPTTTRGVCNSLIRKGFRIITPRVARNIALTHGWGFTTPYRGQRIYRHWLSSHSLLMQPPSKCTGGWSGDIIFVNCICGVPLYCVCWRPPPSWLNVVYINKTPQNTTTTGYIKPGASQQDIHPLYSPSTQIVVACSWWLGIEIVN